MRGCDPRDLIGLNGCVLQLLEDLSPKVRDHNEARMCDYAAV